VATIILRVTPTDYEAWHELHLGQVENMKGATVKSDTLYRDQSDGKSLVVVQEVEDVEAFMAFFSSPELQKIIEEAPIEAPPEMWICDELERVF
jgi:quinol monooxygenase YgiN